MIFKKIIIKMLFFCFFLINGKLEESELLWKINVRDEMNKILLKTCWI